MSGIDVKIDVFSVLDRGLSVLHRLYRCARPSQVSTKLVNFGQR